VTGNEENPTPKDVTTTEGAVQPESMEHEQEMMDNEFENEFADDDEFGTDELEAGDGELTPNDIFGLDPLDVLTLEELAEYLKVSAAAARRAVKEQNLPGRNIGGEWRFLRDAVANWLRGQEAPVAQQQKVREEYSRSSVPPQEEQGQQFGNRGSRSYEGEQAGGEYRPRQRFGSQQSGDQRGQFRRGQYGQYGGGGGGGEQYSGGEYTGGTGHSRPPRRPFRSGGEGGGYGSGGEGGGGGYGGYGGGGGQRFGGGPKRKNKRQIFVNERGKRMDRRRHDDQSEGQ
jgi:excisionase family DNA binding protein